VMNSRLFIHSPRRRARAALEHIEAEHIGGPAPVLLPLAVDF
jgi:hypothetical protein